MFPKVRILLTESIDVSSVAEPLFAFNIGFFTFGLSYLGIVLFLC